MYSTYIGQYFCTEYECKVLVFNVKYSTLHDYMYNTATIELVFETEYESIIPI